MLPFASPLHHVPHSASGDNCMRRYALSALWLSFAAVPALLAAQGFGIYEQGTCSMGRAGTGVAAPCADGSAMFFNPRSEEHTSELQSLAYLVCRLLLEKKKKKIPKFIEQTNTKSEQMERLH